MPVGGCFDGLRRLRAQILALCFSHLGLYVFFGVCTTLLNFLLFLLLFRCCALDGWLSNALAWWPSVVFAWWTNRKWVFDAHQCTGRGALLLELVRFTWSRIATGIADVVLIWLTVDLARWNELAMKVVVGVLIVIGNYVLSRWWIFKKREER